MDASKVMAAAFYYDGDPWDMIHRGQPDPHIPTRARNGPIRFPVWEPNRRSKTGPKVVAARRQVSGFAAKPVTLVRSLEIGGRKVASRMGTWGST